jgi:hypothetical protein
MATRLTVLADQDRSFQTDRKDSWWSQPLVVFLGLTAFVAYSTWALWQADYYYAEPYLSPMYSPGLFAPMPGTVAGAPAEHAWFGAWPAWWPGFIPASPAIWILVFPLSFRFTCYYYRKAYYRAFVGSPPACAVAPMAKGKTRYRGEAALLIFQNLHRYALYFALAFLVILYYDAFLAFEKNGEFGFGLGTLILLVNPTLLAMYTFGCHSFRHLIGGHDDCMSCGQNTVKYGTWKKVSWLNAHHAKFAWASLIFVAFTDIYVRLVAMGVIVDPNTWGS